MQDYSHSFIGRHSIHNDGSFDNSWNLFAQLLLFAPGIITLKLDSASNSITYNRLLLFSIAMLPSPVYVKVKIFYTNIYYNLYCLYCKKITLDK